MVGSSNSAPAEKINGNDAAMVGSTDAPDHVKINGSDDNNMEEINDVGLLQLAHKMQEFSHARDWDRFHSPRNLLLALVGEVGELSEIFQWKGEVEKGLPDWSVAEKEHLGDELSDVLLYLTRLADVCGVDLSRAVVHKLAKNHKKYPAPNDQSM